MALDDVTVCAFTASVSFLHFIGNYLGRQPYQNHPYVLMIKTSGKGICESCLLHEFFFMCSSSNNSVRVIPLLFLFLFVFLYLNGNKSPMFPLRKNPHLVLHYTSLLF